MGAKVEIKIGNTNFSSSFFAYSYELKQFIDNLCNCVYFSFASFC